MNKNVDSTGTTGTYTATVDTTLPDVKLSLTVVSRIPLDPEMYFLFKASTIHKTITNTTTITHGLTFWQRFGISAQVGVGMGLITKQFDTYAGIGFHFQIL